MVKQDQKRKETATQHLLDTEIKLATCNRCGAYVFAASVSGLTTAADPTPLDGDQYRAALIAGLATYDVITQAGRPWKLRRRTAALSATPCAIVAAHACGAHGMDATGVTEVVQGPLQARVSATGRQGPPCASVTPQTGYSPVRVPPVTPPRTDHHGWTPRPLRCDTCRRPVRDGQPYWAIECGTTAWAAHDVCP